MINNTRQTLIRQNHILLASAICAFVIFSLFNYRFNIIADISHNNRYSLHADTKKLLNLLQDDISIYVFTENKATGKKVKKYLKPLLNYKKNINITFINPIDNPKTSRELNYKPETPIHISYQNKVVYTNKINQNSLHNILQKLLNKDSHLIAFSTGFGERKPYDEASFNYSKINTELNNNNFKVIEINLARLNNVPENAAALVIAAPVEPLDEDNINKIIRFIDQGGNLLWLADTDSQALPEKIQTKLGIALLDGLIVDANSQKYIENKPDFIPVESYADNTILGGMKTISLFPQVRGLQLIANNNPVYKKDIILQSSINSWTETGLIRGNIAFNENTNEVAGPVVFGVTFSRPQNNQQDQRIAFIGDADFIANAYIGNGSNINVALRLFRWLSYQQELLSINTVSAPDRNLSLSNDHFFAISLFYIIILPCAFLLISIWFWHTRKNNEH